MSDNHEMSKSIEDVRGLLKESLEDKVRLTERMKLAQDRVSMLEAGLNLKTTTHSVHVTADPDSLEIGTQKDGRVKVYGNLSNKKAFAEKLNNAIELIEAAKKKLDKLNGGE